MTEDSKPIRVTFVDVDPDDTEALIRLFEAMTGRPVTPEERAELEDT